MADDEYPPLFERTEVDGVKVIKDEVLPSGLSGHVGKLVPLHGTRVLTLETGAITYGCRDCPFTGERGEVKVHRAAEHGGASLGGKRAKQEAPAGVRPLPYPSSETLSMSLLELLELADHVGDWEDVLANQERQIDRYKEVAAAEREEWKVRLAEERRRRTAAEKELTKLQKKLAALIGVPVAALAASLNGGEG